jgi:hypothetical protein
MKRQFLYLCLATILFAAASGFGFEDITLDWSQTIDASWTFGKVTILDSASPPEQTVIDYYGTGEVFETFDSSILNLYDGASFLDGGLRDYNWLHDTSTVNLYAGGQIGATSMNMITLLDDSSLNVYGGTVWCLLVAEGSSVITLYDGSLDYGFSADENSIVNVYGGSIGSWVGWDCGLASTATLNFYGYGFTYERIQLPGEEWSFGRLTGYDLSGNPIVYDYIPDPSQNPNIHFIPEPGTVLLLGLGGVMIRKR